MDFTKKETIEGERGRETIDSDTYIYIYTYTFMDTWTLTDGEAELSLISKASSPFGLPGPPVRPRGPM